MKVSVCITVLNEEKSISKLIESLLNQSKKPDEVIIVDGGSIDNTVSLIKHIQKKDKRIKLFVEKCNRAKGRNLSIEFARNEIIATTDADCTAERDWLKKISKPFKNKEVDIVAGFYSMKTENDFQKAASYFLGVLPSRFDKTFLPSTRSMGFRKSIWEKIGGFPETKGNSSEDTDYNQKATEIGANYAHAKDARVEWRIPVNLKGFFNKIYNYAKWDAKYGVWWHKQKRIKSHNIKSLLKIFRYVFALILIILALGNPLLWLVVITLFIIYSYWSFRKVYLAFGDIKVGLWGMVLQFITDYAAIKGFMIGILHGLF